MILELYITFLITSLLLIGYGFKEKVDLFRIIGTVFLFILATGISPFMPEQIITLEYQTGETEIVNGSTTVHQYNYASYESHTISFFLLLLSIFTFIYIYFDREDYDE